MRTPSLRSTVRRGRVAPPLALVAVGALSGCGLFEDPFTADDPPPRQRADDALQARLLATPPSGALPLAVVLDASASTAGAHGSLVFAFDINDDGSFERRLDAQDGTPTFSTVYDATGTFVARVVVQDASGAVSEATVTIQVDASTTDAPVADLQVDTNRDGAISAADQLHEDLFDSAGGAVLFANIDDDDADGVRDSRDTSASVSAADREDLLPVHVARIPALGDAQLQLTVSPLLAAERIRIFQQQADGTLVVLHDPNASDVMAAGAVTGADSADVQLFAEALVPRTAEWDGRATLTLTLTGADGAVVSTDAVALRAAPVIIDDNLANPEVLYVMNIPDGDDNNAALVQALVEGSPNDVDVYTLDENAYAFDRWVQDNMELGHMQRPGPQGPVSMRVAVQLQRPTGFGGLFDFVPTELLSADTGYVYPGGGDTSHNYGGNLEASPPLPGFPFGRLIYGGGTAGTLLGGQSRDTMNADQVAFLNAQEVQGPLLRVSTEWLAVGHIDEIFQFVPDLSRGAGEPAFRIVVASPAVAHDALAALSADGHGDAVVFPKRGAPYTVDGLLADPDFAALNEAAQTRIDGVVADLKAGLGVSDAMFLPVPVLYEEVGGGLVAAFNPGVQNLVTVRDRLFIPDPEGPHDAGGHDIWQDATRAALSETDLDVIFVDVFHSYHELLGEAHCGTNLFRTPAPTAWWTEEP